MQTKTLDFPLETKSVEDSGRFQGYASVFGNVDYGGDVVEAGAFGESLHKARQKGRVIPLFWDHNPADPIGVWHDIAEDAKGLRVDGELLIETDPQAKRIHALLMRKGIGGLSIGYRIPPGGVEPDEKRPNVQRLVKVDLREVSLVAMPMNVRAKITSVKAILDTGNLPTVREFEEFLRESGFSKSLATAIACKAAPVLRGEPDAKVNEPADFLRALLGKVG